MLVAACGGDPVGGEDGGTLADDGGIGFDAALDAGPTATTDAAPIEPDATLDAAGGDPCEGVDCTGSSDACNEGVCDPRTGRCLPMPVADGAGCDDGNACTEGDACRSGACVASALVDCSVAEGPCTAGVCDPSGGGCVAVPRADGTACDDGSACTAGDVCLAGACGGEPLDCAEIAGACGVGTCDPTSGCAVTPLPDGTACDDESVCSWQDACASSACGGVIEHCSVRTIAVPDEVSTRVYGSGDGSAFTDHCPSGQAMIGVAGRVTSTSTHDRLLSDVVTLCGTLGVLDGAGGPSVVIGPGARVPAEIGRGSSGSGGAVETRTCPANEVVVGFGGTRAGGPTQITLRCAPLTISGSAGAGFTVALGARAPIAPLGTRAAMPVPDADCPPGTIARGSTGREGEIVGAFGLRCGAPRLDLVTTAPLIGLLSGSRLLDDCPVGQAPVGIEAEQTFGFYDRLLARFVMTCGTITIAPEGGGWRASVGPGARVPAVGVRGGTTSTTGMIESTTCPADQIVVGYEGHGDPGYPRRLELRCAPLTVTGSAVSGFAVAAGTITTAPGVGLALDPRFGPIDCPAGMVASGFLTQSGEILDGIALRCAPLLVTDDAPIPL